MNVFLLCEKKLSFDEARGPIYRGRLFLIIEGKNLQNLVNLGANLGLVGFAAFLRRAATPWPAVAALEYREFVPSAVDRRTSSDGGRTRLLFQAHFSETDRCIDLPAGRRRSPYNFAAVAGRRLTPDSRLCVFTPLFGSNMHISHKTRQNTKMYRICK